VDIYLRLVLEITDILITPRFFDLVN